MNVNFPSLFGLNVAQLSWYDKHELLEKWDSPTIDGHALYKLTAGF